MNKVYVMGLDKTTGARLQKVLWATFKLAGDAFHFAERTRELHPTWRVTVVYAD